MGSRSSSTSCGRAEGPQFPPVAGAGTDDPEDRTASVRRLGIPTVTDRVVQASLKLVLEPIFEADFLPCSYGFRPRRRAHDAVAEMRYLDRPLLRVGRRGRHQGLLRRDRPHGPAGPGASTRRGQTCPGSGEGVPQGGHPHRGRRVCEDTDAGTPQGGILSPLLANVALSVLDEHIARIAGWSGHRRRRAR